MFGLFPRSSDRLSLLTAAFGALLISPYDYAPMGIYPAPWRENITPRVSVRKRKRRVVAAKQKRKKRVRPNKSYLRSLRRRRK